MYAIGRTVLAPWCKQHGFKRNKSGRLGWYKAVDDGFLAFWLQCSMDGWDGYAGSKFVIEFQLAPTPDLYHGRRARFAQLASADQLTEAWRLQNRVIAKLPKPPGDYFIFGMEGKFVDWYLSKFQPVTEEYTNHSDIWFRYHDAEDVTIWAHFLLDALPTVLSHFYARWDQESIAMS